MAVGNRVGSTRSSGPGKPSSAVAEAVQIPVIASGGAGHPRDLVAVLTEGRADAALAASIFHEDAFPIPQTKQYLRAHGVPVR